MNFSLNSDDFQLILKGLAHFAECSCITVGEAADTFDLIVKIEGLTDPTKDLLHLDWGEPSEWEREL